LGTFFVLAGINEHPIIAKSLKTFPMRTPMLAALLLLLFFSCNQRNSSDNARAPVVANPAAADSAVVASSDHLDLYKTPSGEAPQQPRVGTASQPAANPDWDRKIVKTADLTIETKSFARFADRLHRLVRDNIGYIAQEEQTQSALRIDNTVSIKVPVDRFDEFIQQIPADSDQLTDKKVTSQDVSMEVVDTKSRLETKKEVRERYLDLLRQAHNMKDILSMQQEIDGLQEEMDAASGRINFLSHAAAFSTVNLKFFQILNPNAIETPTTEPGFLHKIKLAFLAGWEALSSLLLGLMTVWPLWLAAALGLAAWRRYQSRTARTSRTTRKPA
jgi:hypothetical protein